MAEWLLYEHDDGRHAVAPSAEAATFAHGDPAWHRVGPVEVPDGLARALQIVETEIARALIARHRKACFEFATCEPKDHEQAGKELIAATEALEAALSAPGVTEAPAGWKLVPEKATSEMERAADDYATSTANRPKGMWWWGRVYEAMLKAAPSGVDLPDGGQPE